MPPSTGGLSDPLLNIAVDTCLLLPSVALQIHPIDEGVQPTLDLIRRQGLDSGNLHWDALLLQVLHRLLWRHSRSRLVTSHVLAETRIHQWTNPDAGIAHHAVSRMLQEAFLEEIPPENYLHLCSDPLLSTHLPRLGLTDCGLIALCRSQALTLITEDRGLLHHARSCDVKAFQLTDIQEHFAWV